MEMEQLPAQLESHSHSSSDSDSGEDVPAAFFGAYDTMPYDGSDCEDDEDAHILDYSRLVEQEGLQHTIRSVPLGSKLEPLGAVVCIVEKILVLRPFDISRLVDIDTLVVRSSDLAVIGKVIEVFGPVESPFYSVLCHSEHLESSSTTLAVGTGFSYLPEQASLVDSVELRAQKITDADDTNGGNGVEAFYSDDEEEAMARRKNKGAKPKRKVADLEPGEISE